ncbi:trifunctional histidinol dehydrogenase [Coemansia pectinata]|uniref:Histidine biosynthesis trifunctional protein n=1 Tax=Coemansia pectinata TaxID=1052879 RepID=A0A9W8GY85_9FUNG|nr:trifunctional histidinol dehydrogenase [Coemansia pectinata]
MLVPKISPSQTLGPALKRALGLLPSVLYTDASEANVAGEPAVWAQVSASDDVQALLNSGLSVAVIGADDDDLAHVGGFDRARLALRYASASEDDSDLSTITRAATVGINRAGAVILDLTAQQISAATDSVDVEAQGPPPLAALVRAAERQVIGANGPVRVLVELSGSSEGWTLGLLSRVGSAGASAVVDAGILGVGDDCTGRLELGAALVAACGLSSDRTDGLVTTVVVDEQRACLGVAYSNGASLAAALASGDGVYWSRKRGLWHKGLTSGATQTLVGVSVDCDADALCFRVRQQSPGFCHRQTNSCFGPAAGLARLAQTVADRRLNAPEGSYTRRLFDDSALLRAKIVEEAGELADATDPADVAFEAADLLYFAMVKCAAHGVSLADVERSLDRKHLKVIRRPGDAKPGAIPAEPKAPTPAAAIPEVSRTSIQNAGIRAALPGEKIALRVYSADELSESERDALLQRPLVDSQEIMRRVRPIVDAVRARGDAAVLELTAKFDGAQMDSVVVRAPFNVPELPDSVRAAIDQAYANVRCFHAAQLPADSAVETMPGVTCRRFSRAIERVGLYVPGGTAVLPSSALMLGVPAQVAGCREIVLATPPRPDGSIVPEVLYVAHKVGATAIVKAGGAQAIAAMAYGTESVPKVDKICGPGNQYVTAAKMLAQNDSDAMVSIDMPAGPSEILVVADATSNPAYVASDLLSQAEHGPDSQAVLLAVGLSAAQMAAIEAEIDTQAARLPRVDIVRQSVPKGFCLCVSSMADALAFSNAYAPEHLILQTDSASDYVKDIVNAGSVFVGHYSPESCGDYASGTNHTLPTYGYSKMYSGVNTATFLKHITSQELTRDGLANIAQTVMTLAEVEELEAHRNAVAIRLKDL